MTSFFKHIKIYAISFFIFLYVVTGLAGFFLAVNGNPSCAIPLLLFGFLTYMCIMKYDLIMSKIKEAYSELEEK